MIEINERFVVHAPVEQTFAVLSDPRAVVECIAGARLGSEHEDGTFEGAVMVKFSALRVQFSGRVGLDLDPAMRHGRVIATGRDGQGGTKFKAVANFQVEPADAGASSEVIASGEVRLSGKLAPVIEGAAGAVVKRMTADFVEALALRCARGGTRSSGAHPGRPDSADDGVSAVVLLHGLGGTPNNLGAWADALTAEGFAVSVPRLPGHGARWHDLRRVTSKDLVAAADQAVSQMSRQHGPVTVMGLGMGATLALRLAENQAHSLSASGPIAGLVLVNPLISLPLGMSGLRLALAKVSRSYRPSDDTVRRPGARPVVYRRVPVRAVASARELGRAAVADLARLAVPTLIVTSASDHLVTGADSAELVQAAPPACAEQLRAMNSDHYVPLDNDAAELFASSVAFIRRLGSRTERQDVGSTERS